MKSLMEEASSISKAIENAWNRAGNPQEFSVKILELPKTSFFGLKTAKSAKVALFFNEVTIKIKEQGKQQTRPLPQQQGRPAPRTADQQPDTTPRSAQGQQRRPMPSQQRPERAPESRHNAPRQDARPFQRPERSDRQERPQDASSHPQRSEQRRPERSSSYSQRSQEPREAWSPEMVEAAQEWLKETLVLMGKPDITISSHVSHNYLKLFLSNRVMEDSKQEEVQLKSWGSLAMEAVREKSNKPLRNLRVVLENKR